MMKSKYLLYLFAISFLCFSCQEEINHDDQEIINIKLKEKNRRYSNDILKICRQEIVQNAERYVDSLFAEQIQLTLNDTIYFPLKPERPVIRDTASWNDTIKIKPMFERKK